MSYLEQAIKNYLESEKILNDSGEQERKLKSNFRQNVEAVGYDNSIAAAEKVYNSNSAMVAHQKQVELEQAKKKEAAEIIKAHLVLMEKNPIVYVDQLTDARQTTLTYSFYLNDKEEVTHNQHAS